MRTLILLSGCLLLAACGSSGADDPPQTMQVGPMEDGTELRPGLLPVRVGHVEVGRSTIDFVRVFTQTDTAIDPVSDDHQEPSIIVMQRGFYGDPDPVAEVRASSGLTLTSAEIYLGLRGEGAALPEALALAHTREASELGRTLEFQTAFRQALPPRTDPGTELASEETDKAEFRRPVQVLDANFTADIPGRRWTNVQTGGNNMVCMGTCPPTTTPPTIRSYWACSNRASFETIGFYSLPISSSCTSTRTAGWVRVGAVVKDSSATGETATVQGFYGPSTDGQWVSYPSETASLNEYFVWDWNTTKAKSLSFAISRERSDTMTARLMTGMSVPN